MGFNPTNKFSSIKKLFIFGISIFVFLTCLNLVSAANSTICVQNQTDSNATGNTSSWCSGWVNSSGNYSGTGWSPNTTRLYDSNYSSSALGTGTEFYINYFFPNTIPSHYRSNAIWSIKDGLGYRNLTIPSICYSYSDRFFLSMYAIATSSKIIYLCYLSNGTSYYIQELSGSYEVYEESMYWIFDEIWAENSQTYSATTRESLNETFIINISYDYLNYSSISAILYYNDSSYIGTLAGSNGNVTFTKSLTIPSSAVGTQNFYWTIALTNSTNTYYFNSSENSQTVSTIEFARCNATYVNPILVNYSIWDEITTTDPVTAVLKATFDYSLDNSYSKSYYLETTANTTFQFCSNYNGTFNVKATILLENASYHPRTYELIENYSNASTRQKKLYMLPTTNGTNVIIEVKDSGNIPLTDYFVEIYRFYPETNNYTQVISDQTDLYGQIVAKLIENTVKYKFLFRDSNGTLVKTSEGVTIACRATICVLPFIIEDTTDDFDRFVNDTDYDWSFTFDNSTNIFTFSWNDVSGSSATMRLLVERYQANGTTTVCNSTSTASSGSITCDVGSSTASYQAQIFRQIVGSTEKRLATLSKKVGDLSGTFGKEGFLWGFFFLMTCLAFGYWKPPVGLVLYGFGFVVLMITQIIYINPAIMVAEGVILVLFIWLFKG